MHVSYVLPTSLSRQRPVAGAALRVSCVVTSTRASEPGNAKARQDILPDSRKRQQCLTGGRPVDRTCKLVAYTPRCCSCEDPAQLVILDRAKL